MTRREDPPALGRIADLLARALLGVATAAILVMLVIIAGNAISRQLAGEPISGAFEIGRVLMPVVVLGGMAWAFGHVGHFRMHAVRNQLGPWPGRISDTIQILIALALFGLLSYLLGIDAWESWQRREYLPGAVAIPVYPTRVAMALGCVGVVVMLVNRLFGAGLPDSPDQEGSLDVHDGALDGTDGR